MVEPVDGSLEARVPALRRFPAVHQGPQEVVGDDADEEFAPDHSRAAAGQHRHAEGGLEIVDEQLHLPAVQVEGADPRCGHPIGIGHGAREVDLRCPEPGSGIHGDAHDAYGDAVGHARIVGGGHPFRPDVGFLPALDPVALAEPRGAGIGLAPRVCPHDDLHTALFEEIQREPAAEAAVRHDGVTGPDMPPELAAEVALAAAERGGGRVDPDPGGQVKQADEAHDGEAAAFLLRTRLRPCRLVGGGVRYADGGAVDDEGARQSAGAHPGDEAAVDLQGQADGDTHTGLAIGGGAGRADGLPFPAEEGLGGGNGVAARSRGECLAEEHPESHGERKGAAPESGNPGKQFDGEQVAEEILGLAHAKRADFGSLFAHSDAVPRRSAAMEIAVPAWEHGSDGCHWLPRSWKRAKRRGSNRNIGLS